MGGQKRHFSNLSVVDWKTNQRNCRKNGQRMVGSSKARMAQFKAQTRPSSVVGEPLPQREKGNVDLNEIGNLNGESSPATFFRFNLNTSLKEPNRLRNDK